MLLYWYCRQTGSRKGQYRFEILRFCICIIHLNWVLSLSYVIKPIPNLEIPRFLHASDVAGSATISCRAMHVQDNSNSYPCTSSMTIWLPLQISSRTHSNQKLSTMSSTKIKQKIDQLSHELQALCAKSIQIETQPQKAHGSRDESRCPVESSRGHSLEDDHIVLANPGDKIL